MSVISWFPTVFRRTAHYEGIRWHAENGWMLPDRFPIDVTLTPEQDEAFREKLHDLLGWLRHPPVVVKETTDGEGAP